MKKIVLILIIGLSLCASNDNSCTGKGIKQTGHIKHKKGRGTTSLYSFEYISESGTEKCIIFMHTFNGIMNSHCFPIKKDESKGFVF